MLPLGGVRTRIDNSRRITYVPTNGERPKPNRKRRGGERTRKYDSHVFVDFFYFNFLFCFTAREPVVLQHGRGQQNHDQRFRSVQDRGLGRDGHGLRNSRIRRYVTVLHSVFRLWNWLIEGITVRADSKINAIFSSRLCGDQIEKIKSIFPAKRGTF